MSNLSNNIQNIEASRSTIEGMDFVAEAADLAKNQILAQSATAMLAQASAISQNVLGLLRLTYPTNTPPLYLEATIVINFFVGILLKQRSR